LCAADHKSKILKTREPFRRKEIRARALKEESVPFDLK